MRREYDVIVVGGGTAGITAAIQAGRAGAMAAISARTGIDPEQIPMADLRGLLREHGAIVPGC